MITVDNILAKPSYPKRQKVYPCKHHSYPEYGGGDYLLEDENFGDGEW